MAATGRAVRLVDRAVPYRWTVLVGWLCVVAGLAALWRDDGDWGFFRLGAGALTGRTPFDEPGGTHLYASFPAVQIGPPGLVAALALRPLPEPWDVVAAQVLVAVAVLPLMVLLERFATALGVPAERRDRAVLLGGFALVPAWVVIAEYAHLDDALVLALAVYAMLQLARDRTLPAAVAIGLAAATKPWAVVLVAALLRGGARSALRPLLVAGGVAVACWAPFLTDPQALPALSSFRLAVDGASGLAALGVEVGSGMPTWVRPVQVGAGLLLAAVATYRGQWTAACLVGLAVRVALDPNPMHYYGSGVVLGALLWDVARRRSGIPWCTVVAAAAFSVLGDLGPATGAARLVVCAGLVVAVLIQPVDPRRPAGTGQIARSRLRRSSQAPTSSSTAP